MMNENSIRVSKYSDILHYRYRLNTNSDLDNITLEGISLNKENWAVRKNPYKKVEKHIRTKSNPNGVVDYEEYYPTSGKIIYSSKYIFDTTPKIYTRDELGAMLREELVGLARLWEIDPKSKKDQFLRETIVKKQKEHIEKQKISFNDTNELKEYEKLHPDI